MIFELCPIDDRRDHWVFYSDDAHDHLVVRPQYGDLVCGGCGKVNEDAALERGVSPDFLVRSSKDWLGTGESWVVVTSAFQQVVQDNNLQGLTFVSMPSDEEHYLAICTCLAQTDREKAGFQTKNRCSVCRRPGERYEGPLVDGLVVPESPMTFFSSEVANESVKASYRPIFAQKPLVDILKRHAISGIDYLEAL